jgi:hypothetical protein
MEAGEREGGREETNGELGHDGLELRAGEDVAGL